MFLPKIWFLREIRSIQLMVLWKSRLYILLFNNWQTLLTRFEGSDLNRGGKLKELDQLSTNSGQSGNVSDSKCALSMSPISQKPFGVPCQIQSSCIESCHTGLPFTIDPGRIVKVFSQCLQFDFNFPATNNSVQQSVNNNQTLNNIMCPKELSFNLL